VNAWDLGAYSILSAFMRAVDLILQKRDGGRLSHNDIRWFIDGVTAGTVPDYQTAALLMAVVWRGLDEDETVWLTDAMVRSGGRVDLSSLSGVKVGKHSTGGVGDTISLVLVPLLAACGALVPKSSGRALGHTGGTIDKLESIPGFRVTLTSQEFLSQVAEIGCAMVGQSKDLAPADKKLYALRDVTGTVESLPLIASSIMSKKIAEGTDALVLDVKVGAGAFMKTLADARRLATAMVAIGNRNGLRTRAVLTDMDVPLGAAIGNALEVIEAIETLKGRGPDDLRELCLVLASHLLVVSGLQPDLSSARAQAASVLASGAALERFRQLIAHQGGDASVIDDYGRFPAPARREVLAAPSAGYVAKIKAEEIGRASMLLGAGRASVDAPIDYGAGILLRAKPGDRVTKGAPLADLAIGAHAHADDAISLASSAFVIAPDPPPAAPLVLDIVA
jgi:pyrimidine-nucleoside phosphorylase